MEIENMSGKLIKQHEYTSKDAIRVILKIFAADDGYVLEQTKIYDFDGSRSIETVFLPNNCLKVEDL